MKKLLILSILFVGLTSGKKPEIKLGTIELFNKQVQIKVPASFEIMDDGRMKKVYHSEAMPKVAYSNLEKTVRIGFGAESISTKESGIPIMTIRFEKLLQKLHPKAKWKNQGVQIINGQKVGFIEYINKKPTKFNSEII